ncbi:MAG: hypothetical protein J4F45_10380 [Pseudomonadales bacterium]|nr:hypothetical protein [Pseudomonadales bacterium]
MRDLLSACLKLPPARKTVPGALMEAIVAHVHDARVLDTYDFVDVVDERTKCGWQVKSTKSTTPVTWKRAKLPNAENLIHESRDSESARQELGREILQFCNEHAQRSMEQYGLVEIGYSRLIVDNDTLVYFERPLCSQARPQVFDPMDFFWTWSEPKKTVTKEQLPALHGVHRHTKKRWWAWHGLGENQLHFTGEREWWPSAENGGFRMEMPKNDELISFRDLLPLLDSQL